MNKSSYKYIGMIISYYETVCSVYFRYKLFDLTHRNAIKSFPNGYIEAKGFLRSDSFEYLLRIGEGMKHMGAKRAF